MQEVKMMNFKIRPILGDISLLGKRNDGFLEAIWRIGRIEEVIAKDIHTLNTKERELFFRYLEKIHGSIQRIPSFKEEAEIVEFELIKEQKYHRKYLN